MRSVQFQLLIPNNDLPLLNTTESDPMSVDQLSETALEAMILAFNPGTLGCAGNLILGPQKAKLLSDIIKFIYRSFLASIDCTDCDVASLNARRGVFRDENRIIRT